MSTNKVQVRISTGDNEVALDPTKPIIEEKKVEDFLTSSVNPLHDIRPPQHTAELQNAVLLQAEDIKKTLERIYKSDPTARCHNFPYIIAPENEKLLVANGFFVKKTFIQDTQEAFTEVCWDGATKWWMTIPLPSNVSMKLTV